MADTLYKEIDDAIKYAKRISADEVAIIVGIIRSRENRQEIKDLIEKANDVCETLEHPTKSVNALQMWKLRDAINAVKEQQ